MSTTHLSSGSLPKVQVHKILSIAVSEAVVRMSKHQLDSLMKNPIYEIHMENTEAVAA